MIVGDNRARFAVLTIITMKNVARLALYMSRPRVNRLRALRLCRSAVAWKAASRILRLCAVRSFTAITPGYVRAAMLVEFICSLYIA